MLPNKLAAVTKEAGMSDSCYAQGNYATYILLYIDKLESNMPDDTIDMFLWFLLPPKSLKLD